MLSGGNIPIVAKRVIRTDESVLRDALKFIFRPDNVQLLAWGTREVRQREGSIYFAAVIRKTSKQQIWRDCLSFRTKHPLSGGHRTLGHTVFLQLVNTFRKGEQKRQTSVYYMLGAIVYDSVALLKSIVQKEVGDIDTRRMLSLSFIAVTVFIKFGSTTHIEKNADPVHDVKYGILDDTSFDWAGTKKST